MEGFLLTITKIELQVLIMQSTAKVLGLIIAGLVVFIFAFMTIAGFLYPAGFTVLGIVPDSTYSYDVEIAAGYDITDATFFFPLPSYKENSPVGVSIIDGEGYGLDESIDTELFGAKDAMMLKVTSENLIETKRGKKTEAELFELYGAENPGIPVVLGDTLKVIRFGGESSEKSLIDTQNPLENSCLLSPVMKLSEKDDSAQYKTYVYTKYDTSPDCNVDIRITVRGQNSWQFFMPKMNYYSNEITLKLKGPQSGWQTADATLKSGMGDYSIAL